MESLLNQVPMRDVKGNLEQGTFQKFRPFFEDLLTHKWIQLFEVKHLTPEELRVFEKSFLFLLHDRNSQMFLKKNAYELMTRPISDLSGHSKILTFGKYTVAEITRESHFHGRSVVLEHPSPESATFKMMATNESLSSFDFLQLRRSMSVNFVPNRVQICPKLYVHQNSYVFLREIEENGRNIVFLECSRSLNGKFFYVFEWNQQDKNKIEFVKDVYSGSSKRSLIFK